MTIADTTTAARAHGPLEGILEVLELVHDPVTVALQALTAKIMAARNPCEISRMTGVDNAIALAVLEVQAHLVLDVKAKTGRAERGAALARDALLIVARPPLVGEERPEILAVEDLARLGERQRFRLSIRQVFYESHPFFRTDIDVEVIAAVIEQEVIGTLQIHTAAKAVLIDLFFAIKADNRRYFSFSRIVRVRMLRIKVKLVEDVDRVGIAKTNIKDKLLTELLPVFLELAVLDGEELFLIRKEIFLRRKERVAKEIDIGDVFSSFYFLKAREIGRDRSKQ